MDRPPPVIGAAGLLNADEAGGAGAEVDIQGPVVAVITGHLDPLLTIRREAYHVAAGVIVGRTGSIEGQAADGAQFVQIDLKPHARLLESAAAPASVGPVVQGLQEMVGAGQDVVVAGPGGKRHLRLRNVNFVDRPPVDRVVAGLFNAEEAELPGGEGKLKRAVISRFFGHAGPALTVR